MSDWSYAAGYGAVVRRDLRHYSGKYRLSAFAGDSPKVSAYTYDSIAHMAGLQGTVYVENVLGHAQQAAIALLDS